jgi:hypothetical protein
MLPMRLNLDGAPDLVILREGSSAPAVLLTAPLATFTVDSTANTADFNTGDGVCDTNDSVGDGPCTLRAAIEQANASVGMDTIEFNLGAETPTITPSSALPAITEQVTINGNTGGATQIVLDGPGSAGFSASGLQITGGSGTVLRNMQIVDFNGNGITLTNPMSGNMIEGCYIGGGWPVRSVRPDWRRLENAPSWS